MPEHRTSSTLLRPVALLLLIGGLVVACASAGTFRQENRRNLQRLQVGMDRAEVVGIMGIGQERQLIGSETQGPVGTGRDTLGVTSVRIPTGSNTPILYNPHRSELYDEDGTSWEVLFYYTQVARDDGMVTDDELTPIVLEDGTLTGWGWTHWAAQNGRHRLGAELPDPLPDPDLSVP